MNEFKITYPTEGMTSHLLMTPLGKHLYRLEETEVFLEEPLYFGDVIEAKRKLWGGLEFRKLVKRSGLVVCDFILPRDLAASERLQVLLRRVKEEGGRWEMMFGGILITHLLPGSKLDLEKELGRLQSRPNSPAGGD